MLARKEDASIKTERFKIRQEVQNAVRLNINVCANNMSLVSLKT